MTPKTTSLDATHRQGAPAPLDFRWRSQRELVAASLLRCPNDRHAKGRG